MILHQKTIQFKFSFKHFLIYKVIKKSAVTKQICSPLRFRATWMKWSHTNMFHATFQKNIHVWRNPEISFELDKKSE